MRSVIPLSSGLLTPNGRFGYLTYNLLDRTRLRLDKGLVQKLKSKQKLRMKEYVLLEYSNKTGNIC